MSSLSQVLKEAKITYEGKLTDPNVLEKIARKLKINTNIISRKKPLVKTGKAWKTQITTLIIKKATDKIAVELKRNEKILSTPSIQRKVYNVDEKKYKKTFVREYRVVFPNPQEDISTYYEEMMRFNNEYSTSSTLVFVVLIFKQRNSNRVRFITANVAEFDTLDDFEEYLNKLYQGEQEGTDKVDKNEFDLKMDLVGYKVFDTLQGEGSNKTMIFEIENECEKDNKKCGNNCLEYCGFKTTDKITCLNDMVKIITDNDLKIRIVNNIPSFNHATFGNSIKHAPFKSDTIIINKKNKKIKKATLQNNFTSKINEIHTCEGYKNTIIFCENGKHYSIAKNNEMIFKKDTYIDLISKSIGNDNGFCFNYQQLIFYNKPEPVLETDLKPLYVFFDLETIIDWDNYNIMMPYSLSILTLDEKQLEELEQFDKENNKSACENMRRNFCKTWVGYDCVKFFLEWICANQKNKQFKFIGFNNANFDNFFILKEIMNGYCVGELLLEIQESDIFMCGSSLNNFTINGRHSFFDLKKHLTGSLDGNCKSWGVNCCSKLSFNHDEAQALYDDEPQKLIDYCLGAFPPNENGSKGSISLIEYNEYDVISTAVILQKYKNELNAIPCVVSVINDMEETKSILCRSVINDITNIGTIGSLIYKVFVAECKENEITFDLLDKFKYDELSRCKIAGRVELFNGEQHITERCASTDVCSLYPYVLSVAPVYYPSGKITEVNEFMGYDRIGFYWVSFNQASLREMKNLPNIYAFKTGIRNEWDYKEEIKQYLLSTEILKLLNDYGVDYEFDSPVSYMGFVFEKQHKSCEMFRFLLEIMGKKNEQDQKKQKKDPTYNGALRETLKLLMNAISGKVIEGLHTEQTEILDGIGTTLLVNKLSATEEESTRKNKIKKINAISSYGDKLIVNYEVYDKYLIHKQRPIFLGVLLYDYAKSYMYRTSYSKVGLNKLLYTDTDASKMRYSDFMEWRKYAETTIVPHHKEVEEYDPRYATHTLYNPHSKVFGSFEDELEDYIGEDYEFFCLQKKTWLYRFGNEAKYRFKGINDRSLQMDLETEIPDFVSEIRRTNPITKIRETGYSINQQMGKSVNDYYNANKNKQLKGMNAYKLFQDLYKDKSAYVLTSSFKKQTNNSQSSIGIDGEINQSKLNNIAYSIQMNYMLKKITL